MNYRHDVWLVNGTGCGSGIDGAGTDRQRRSGSGGGSEHAAQGGDGGWPFTHMNQPDDLTVIRVGRMLNWIGRADGSGKSNHR